MSKKEDVELVTLIEEINEVLKKIKDEQVNQRKMLIKNHKVNMQKLSKLIEFNEIMDMTNQVFERRISSIEALLYEVFKS